MSQPQWTDRERRDFDQLKTDTNYYDRRMLLSVNAVTKEITLVPAVWNGRELRSLDAPIVPLSLTDAMAMIDDLQVAVMQREDHLKRNP